MKRLLLAVILTLAASFGNAATVADRSPFAQGLWWDSTRSGNGFDIFNVGDEVMVLWYTYDAGGRAIWYTAQGSLRSQPSAPLTLLQHRWSGGHKADATAVGTLRLDIKSPELIEVSWAVGAMQGKWSLRPFIVSGIMNEVDHSGTWFDPANSGWGFSMIEQGDVLGTIVYTYDASGAPTWIAGFGRDRTGVELSRFDGTCPSCAYRAPSASSVGRLGFDFWQEWEITLRNNLSVPMAQGVRLDGTRVTQLSRPASLRPADRQLASFADDAALKGYLDAGMLNVITSTGGFSSPPAATAFSTTNLQEAGVDEADLVKTDGRYVYTFASAGGFRRPTLRIAEVGDEGTALSLRGQVALQGGSEMTMSSAGLFLHGDRLVSVTGTRASSSGGGFGWPVSGNWTRGITSIEVMSRAVPEAPATLWRVEVDGHMIASRRIGDRLYVVTRFVPYLAGFIYGANYSPYAEMNRQLLAAAPLSALLPAARINGGASSPVVTAASVHAPPQGERPLVADMIVVLAIDLATPRIAQSLGILGGVEAVYASPANLYLATSRTIYRASTGLLLPIEPSFVATDIHQVRLASGAMSIVGTGSVEGFLGGDPDKAAFRLGEHDARLRVVSSSYQMWGGTTNRLTVLEPSTISPGLLRTVSVLPNAQRPQALGKPNELLYATRFAEDRLYAVTFRKIDPLYVVDVSNAADPRIAGELALPGFSDYLHPLPNGLLVGFGKDARPAGGVADGQFAWYQGLQLTLFDVRDANQPRELQRKVIGKRGSDSALLRDHHAFSSLAQADGSTSIAIPARIHDGATPPGASDSTFYPWVESGLLRFEVRGSSAADAQLVQLPSLVTHSVYTTGDLYPGQDAAVDGGRSILYKSGVIYVINGQFWRLPTNGGFGPFVPNGPL